MPPGLSIFAAGEAVVFNREITRAIFAAMRCNAVIFLPNFLYNQTMNLSGSFLFRCCLAAVLLLSLWVGGVQNFCVDQAVDASDIVLSVDGDSVADDAFDQLALFAGVSLPAIVFDVARYQQTQIRSIIPGYFTPPDRPPAELA